jgi:hypothetical protein
MFISLNQMGSVVLDVFSNRLDAVFLGTNGLALDTYTILKDVPADSAPLFVHQPEDLAVANGGKAEFNPALTGAVPMTYQWHKDGVALPGRITRALTFSAAALTDSGAYSLVASNSSGVATSLVTLLKVVLPLAAGTGTGLRGDYYDDAAFSVFRLSRIDPTVNFNWGTGSPGSTIGVDTYSVRWTGDIEARYTGPHTFYTYSDDGVRLWIDGQLLIDNFIDHAPTENQATVNLVAGRRHFIRMDYYESTQGSVAALSWSPLGAPKQIVPASQLYPVSSPSIKLARSGGTLHLSFPTQPSRTYRVEYKDSLTDANWQTLRTVTGNSELQSAMDSIGVHAGRIYRVMSY